MRPIARAELLREKTRRVDECKSLQNEANIQLPAADNLRELRALQNINDTGEMNVVRFKAKIQIVLY